MISEKDCPRCNKTQSLDNFTIRKISGKLRHDSWCQNCRRNQSRDSGQRYKYECFLHYGGPVCSCCGENKFEFLAIDHINGDGNIHRREIGKNGSRLCGIGFYLWLKRNSWPEGFRVLCHNCNFSLGAYGYCPHSTESKLTEEFLSHSPKKYVVGSKNSKKLTEEQVLEIRSLKSLGKPSHELMKTFSLSRSQIYKICSRDNWKHI